MKKMRAWAGKHEVGLIYLVAVVLAYSLGVFNVWAGYHSITEDARQTCSLLSGRWVDDKSMCLVPDLVANQLNP